MIYILTDYIIIFALRYQTSTSLILFFSIIKNTFKENVIIINIKYILYHSQLDFIDSDAYSPNIIANEFFIFFYFNMWNVFFIFVQLF